MIRDTLMEAIKDLIAEWKLKVDELRADGHAYRAFDFEDCIEDLESIIPADKRAMTYDELLKEWALERERANRYHGEAHELRMRLRDANFQRGAALQRAVTLQTIVDEVLKWIKESDIKAPISLLAKLAAYSCDGRRALITLAGRQIGKSYLRDDAQRKPLDSSSACE